MAAGFLETASTVVIVCLGGGAFYGAQWLAKKGQLGKVAGQVAQQVLPPALAAKINGGLDPNDDIPTLYTKVEKIEGLFAGVMAVSGKIQDEIRESRREFSSRMANIEDAQGDFRKEIRDARDSISESARQRAAILETVQKVAKKVDGLERKVDKIETKPEAQERRDHPEGEATS